MSGSARTIQKIEAPDDAVQAIVNRIMLAATGVYVALQKGDNLRAGKGYSAKLRAALDEADQQFTKWAEAHH